MFLLSLFKILIYYLTKFLFQLVCYIEKLLFSCFSNKSTKNNYLATNLALLTFKISFIYEYYAQR